MSIRRFAIALAVLAGVIFHFLSVPPQAPALNPPTLASREPTVPIASAPVGPSGALARAPKPSAMASLEPMAAVVPAPATPPAAPPDKPKITQEQAATGALSAAAIAALIVQTSRQ